MATFSKDDYLLNLRDLIKEEKPSDLDQFINEEIDRAVIYYADCFAIIEDLNVTDWSDSDFGNITNITQLAYISLSDFVYDNLDLIT
jgi:hypothetical protein